VQGGDTSMCTLLATEGESSIVIKSQHVTLHYIT
jgi:hypothetical protein